MTEVSREAKIRVLVRENPRREGSAASKRYAAVLRSAGQTVDAAIRKGAKLSTVRHMTEEKVIQLVSPAKKTKTAARKS